MSWFMVAKDENIFVLDSLNMNLESEPPGAERQAFFNCVADHFGTGSIQFCKPGQTETEEYRKKIKGFFHNQPCLYNHQVYRHATAIYTAMRQLLMGLTDVPDTGRRRKKRSSSTENQSASPATEVPSNVFSSANEKRLSLSLVFQTLKYQKFLQEMLKNSFFFDTYPEMESQFSCVMIILCDYQKRKFQRRLPLPAEEIDANLARIEDLLAKCKTKLQSALARSRIASRVLSLDFLLPDSVRNNDKIGSDMNISCWINNLKSSFSQMKEDLSKEGFNLVQSDNDLKGKTFMVDKHCTDVIFFPPHLLDYLESLPVVKKKALVIQDKSSSIGPQSIRCLISDGDDVIHVNVGAAITSAHLASLTCNSDSVIYGFGIETEKQHKQCIRNLEKFGAKNCVKLFTEKFTDVDFADPRFKDIKVIMITANCTRSGVPNPVNFIVSEGEDYDFISYATILRDLSIGHVDGEMVNELIIKNLATLKHALQFPRVQTVVFCSRSLNESENEAVVNASMDYISVVQQTKTPFRLSPPVLPLSSHDIESEVPLSGKFLKYPPSNMTSGCFLATISREADDPKEAAKGILARAAARGIISGLPAAALPSENKHNNIGNNNKLTKKTNNSKKDNKKKEKSAKPATKKTKSSTLSTSQTVAEQTSSSSASSSVSKSSSSLHALHDKFTSPSSTSGYGSLPLLLFTGDDEDRVSGAAYRLVAGYLHGSQTGSSFYAESEPSRSFTRSHCMPEMSFVSHSRIEHGDVSSAIKARRVTDSDVSFLTHQKLTTRNDVSSLKQGQLTTHNDVSFLTHDQVTTHASALQHGQMTTDSSDVSFLTHGQLTTHASSLQNGQMTTDVSFLTHGQLTTPNDVSSGKKGKSKKRSHKKTPKLSLISPRRISMPSAVVIPPAYKSGGIKHPAPFRF